MDGGLVAHELQTVPIARNDQAGVALRLGLAADGADEVVGLIARLLAAGHAQGVQHLLHDRQLGGQLVGHPLAGGLVGVELFVAEGLFLDVKAHDRAVRGILVLQAEERGQKAIDRVRGQAFVVGQHAHAVKGAV